jgi:hypothetical protein
MLFATISARSANSDRGTPASLAESHHTGAHPLRDDWPTLLERWKRVQPYADRFATTFIDTLLASGADFRQIFGGGTLEVQFLRLAHVLTQIVCADDGREEMDTRVELIVRRFARDDFDTRPLRALRTAVTATLREVAASDMSTQARASWNSAYAAIGAVLGGTTYLDTRGVTAIRRTLATGEIVADRPSSSIERMLEATVDAAAA